MKKIIIFAPTKKLKKQGSRMIKHKYGRTQTSLPTEIIELLSDQVSKE